jgi:hypothetical protein
MAWVDCRIWRVSKLRKQANMQKSILAGTFMCLGLAVAEPTQAETWYLRNSADSPSQGVAAPLDYCLRATAVTGGVCARHDDQSSDQQAPQSPRRAEQRRRERRERSER